MAFVTDAQLLQHLQNGKTLGWLVAHGLDPSYLEEFADQHGLVFGSNGVARRSAVPLDLPAAPADDTPEGSERSQDPADYGDFVLASVDSAEQLRREVQAGLGEHAQARADDAASLAGGDELVTRDVEDDQADRALDAALDEIEELDWEHLVLMGRQSPSLATNERADNVEHAAQELRRVLIQERDAAQLAALNAVAMEEALLDLEQAHTQLLAREATLVELAPDSEVRRWAKAVGRNVATRGHVPAELRVAYARAQVAQAQVAS
jgi:hypothetical protein